MTGARIAFLACAALALAPGAARAVTISATADAVIYTADPNELNLLQVQPVTTSAGERIRLLDYTDVAGTADTATVRAQPPCEGGTPPQQGIFPLGGPSGGASLRHLVPTVTDCPVRGAVRISLGDIGDQALITPGLPTANVLDGGPGNDLLGGGDRADVLDGGEGSDSLIGGLGPDVFAGGPGEDAVRYEEYSRTAGVTAAPGGGADDGGPQDGPEGARDDVRDDVEGLAGSQFADRLTGSRLSGLGGDDTLRGGEGADDLTGGSGADVLSGGGGDDRLDAVDADPRIAPVDRVACGAGSGDRVLADLEDRAAADCEQVARPHLRIEARSRLRRGALVLRVRCPQEATAGCDGVVRVDTAPPRRRVGRAEVLVPAGESRLASVRTTRAFRRRLARAGAARLRATFFAGPSARPHPVVQAMLRLRR